MLLCNSKQIREADHRMIDGLGFPGYILMETAGRKAAEEVNKWHNGSKKCIVWAGPGNNGGDGLVMARYLKLDGWHVEVVFSQDPSKYSGDARVAWNSLSGSGIKTCIWPELSALTEDSGAVMVDAILGTGVKGELKGPVADMIRWLAGLPNDIVSIDLPSGLDADSGRDVPLTVKADLTITFQLPKICHHVFPAAARCGQIVVVDIGIWPEVLDSLGVRRFVLDAPMVAGMLHGRDVQSHKGSFGHVLSVGGSARYAGAISLTSHAALRTGAGLSTVFCPEICREAVHAMGPEVMMISQPGSELNLSCQHSLAEALKGKSCVAVGPGLGQEAEQSEFLKQLLTANNQPLVLDADALNILAAHPEFWNLVKPGTVITPHPGEMARLQPDPDPVKFKLEAAEKLAKERDVVVVLKGAGTVVASPDGRTYVNTTGNPGMATGGSGDVLTGMIAGFMATGLNPLDAAIVAAYLHGLSGDLFAKKYTDRGLVASDLITGLPDAIAFLLNQYPVA